MSPFQMGSEKRLGENRNCLRRRRRQNGSWSLSEASAWWLCLSARLYDALELGVEWPTRYAWTLQRIYTASLWYQSTGLYHSFRKAKIPLEMGFELHRPLPWRALPMQRTWRCPRPRPGRGRTLLLWTDALICNKGLVLSLPTMTPGYQTRRQRACQHSILSDSRAAPASHYAIRAIGPRWMWYTARPLHLSNDGQGGLRPLPTLSPTVRLLRVRIIYFFLLSIHSINFTCFSALAFVVPFACILPVCLFLTWYLLLPTLVIW